MLRELKTSSKSRRKEACDAVAGGMCDVAGGAKERADGAAGLT